MNVTHSTLQEYVFVIQNYVRTSEHIVLFQFSINIHVDSNQWLNNVMCVVSAHVRNSICSSCGWSWYVCVLAASL